jgi:hypothetical protein
MIGDVTRKMRWTERVGWRQCKRVRERECEREREHAQERIQESESEAQKSGCTSKGPDS